MVVSWNEMVMIGVMFLLFLLMGGMEVVFRGVLKDEMDKNSRRLLVVLRVAVPAIFVLLMIELGKRL